MLPYMCRYPLDSTQFLHQLPAPGGELVLEFKEVEEVKLTVAGEVAEQIASGKQLLELQEVEDVQHAITVQVGAAAAADTSTLVADTVVAGQEDVTGCKGGADHILVRRAVAQNAIVIVGDQNLQESALVRWLATVRTRGVVRWRG